MDSNLYLDNNLTDYGMLIGCALILGCTLFYLIRSNYTAIPSQNIEVLTNEEIGTIVNENAAIIKKNENKDVIIDSDSDTNVETDHDTIFDSESTSDDESILDLEDLDLFFMPNVDFNVCSIEELKCFEIIALYPKELFEKLVTYEELMSLICYCTEKELLTNWIND
jgi:hypothetical protein